MHCDPHLDQTKYNDLLPLTIDGVLTDFLVIDNLLLVKSSLYSLISLLTGCEDGVSHLRDHSKVSFAAALPPLNLKLACRQTVRDAY